LGRKNRLLADSVKITPVRELLDMLLLTAEMEAKILSQSDASASGTNY